MFLNLSGFVLFSLLVCLYVANGFYNFFFVFGAFYMYYVCVLSLFDVSSDVSCAF